jgi:hypothetical protein
MRKLLALTALVAAAQVVLAQGDIPVGTWRTHNSYNELIGMTQANTLLYAASKNAVFSYDQSIGEIETITALTGLSDTQITTIGYNEITETIIIPYLNGNIDLLKNNKIRNFSALLNAYINDSKKVNYIYSQGSLSYLCTDFGLLILDLENEQVKDTYFELGEQGAVLPIYTALISDDSLYLGTETGIIRGYINDNLKDFNKWLRYDSGDGIPVISAKVILDTPSGLLAALDNEGLYEFDGTSWIRKDLLTGVSFLFGSQDGGASLFTTSDGVYRYDGTSISPIISELVVSPRAAIELNGEINIADEINGVVLTNEENNIYPNGPFESDIVKLFGYNDVIIAFPKAYDNNFTALGNTSGAFFFQNGEWTNYNSTGYPQTITIPEFLDITDAMYVYNTEKLYLSSFGYGVLEIDNNQYTIYDETNSTLTNASPGRNVKVTALDANSSGLSALNYDTVEPLHFLESATNSWQGYSVPFPASFSDQILSFNNNTFWLKIPANRGGGILIYDRINARQLLLDNSILPSNRVNDMAIDREGKMWVATDKGVVYFFNAENILDESFIDPVKPIFEGSILFNNEKISALAVDGGNRIWMGASSGLWLFARNGQEAISHFKVDDSPLPSNEILDLAINYQNGELFIATSSGLVSYRGTSTAAGEVEPLKIFPNPVIASETDIVTIEGLPTNANITITDSSGRLVYKTKANGNTAIWSGVSSSTSLSSGVYFVFVSTADSESKQVGKIGVVK